MLRPSFVAPLAGCLLALACAQAFAAPSPYSTMVVFGDSLADAGQFPDGVSGATLRFTNRTGPTFQGDYGLVSSTQLGSKLGVAPNDLNASTSPVRAAQGLPDGNNWAVGGYRTDNILDSITSVSDTAIPPAMRARALFYAVARVICRQTVGGPTPTRCIFCPVAVMTSCNSASSVQAKPLPQAGAWPTAPRLCNKPVRATSWCGCCPTWA